MATPDGLSENQRDRLGLPIRPFLYTTDQIADLIRVPLPQLLKQFLYFDQRSVGIAPDDKLRAINIAADGEIPEWRVEERELLRWCKHKRILVLSRRFRY